MDKWWMKTGKFRWLLGKHCSENYVWFQAVDSPFFLVEGWDEEKVEETWDISESYVSYWSSAELWVSILSRAAPTFIRFCWK